MGKGEKRTCPGSGIFWVEEQGSGHASASALHLGVAHSQGQRRSEHEQLFLRVSAFWGEIQEGAGAREDVSHSVLWHRGARTPSNSGCRAKRHSLLHSRWRRGLCS